MREVFGGGCRRKRTVFTNVPVSRRNKLGAALGLSSGTGINHRHYWRVRATFSVIVRQSRFRPLMAGRLSTEFD
jgi:hypothetical protein